MTLASAVEVRVPLVAGVAVAREASIVLPADSILALAKATGYVSEARPRVVGSRSRDTLLDRPA